MNHMKKYALSALLAFSALAGIQALPAAHADEFTPAQQEAISTIADLHHLKDFERSTYLNQIQSTQDPDALLTIVTNARNKDWADTLGKGIEND